MLAAVFAVLFGLSLLPGREPLCLKFARRVSGGIMPEGALGYCRKLTWLWFGVCTVAGGLSLAGYWYVSLVVIPALLFAEHRFRNRYFTVTFHTSGSTGGAKTIVKPFECLAKEVVYHSRRWRELGYKPTVLATIHPDHMYGKLWRVMLPAAMGWPVDSEIILTPESLLDKMAKADKVFLITTPSFLMRFLAYAANYEVPQNCMEIITSGALLTGETSRRTREVFGVEPLQIYGSTETGGVASRRGDGLFEAFSTVKIAATRDGRLKVKSPYFAGFSYTLGDGVELKDKRRFKLLGRRDRLVKINEERVNLAEMEERIRGLGFADCALVKLESDKGPYLGCMIAGDKVPPLEMRARLIGIFPRGTVPKKFRFVEAIPKNTQGKVVAEEIRHAFEV